MQQYKATACLLPANQVVLDLSADTLQGNPAPVLKGLDSLTFQEVWVGSVFKTVLEDNK